MFQRNISTEMVKEIIKNGTLIEEYPEDSPCPSALVLGYWRKQPYHIVVAQCDDHVRIITVYQPDKNKWIDFKIRKP